MSESEVSDVPADDPDRLAVDALRVLAMDAVQKANSGHPGTPMALAPLAYVLFTRHLRHDPARPDWVDRDRFVLSCGHASMLLYGALHLSGYDLRLEDLREFRQWGSKTPGHPEVHDTPGVETTTGPLGQGTANALGMAMAEAALEARFNETGYYPVDHHTWFIASDGDLMEGISQEAASLAGHLGLGKLIGFYDDNKITIEGDTDLTLSEDVAARYEACGWHVQRVEDGNDLAAIDDAIDAAKAELERPSLICVRTHIAYGSPNKQDTAASHGAPLGADEVAATREALGWPLAEPFAVPDQALTAWRHCLERGAELSAAWDQSFGKYRKAFPKQADELERCMRGELPESWDHELPDFAELVDGMATRKASGQVLAALGDKLPELIGGSADLGPSNNSVLPSSGSFGREGYGERNVHWGVREHAMGAALNGMALHGGLRPYGATFLIFSDYMRPAMRLAALMRLPVLYIFTHDSIGLGEDGPTHQPIEQLSTLRAIPGLHVHRPGDAWETSLAWRQMIERRDGPSAICLSRQSLPVLDRSRMPEGADPARGGYVLREAQGEEPRLVLLATGSELSLAMELAARLEAEGTPTRVVSMPCHERFLSQGSEYHNEVLAGDVPRLAIEAGHPMSWDRFIGSRGASVGIDHFGASAPAELLFEKFGFGLDALLARARALLDG
jgi:transketolase